MGTSRGKGRPRRRTYNVKMGTSRVRGKSRRRAYNVKMETSRVRGRSRRNLFKKLVTPPQMPLLIIYEILTIDTPCGNTYYEFALLLNHTKQT